MTTCEKSVIATGETDEILKKPAKKWSKAEADAVFAKRDELMAESRRIAAEYKALAEAILHGRGGSERLRELLDEDKAQQEMRRKYIKAIAEYLDLA